MSIVTIEQAKAQGRITTTAEDVLIQMYLDAAEQHACRYLNRYVYADAPSVTAAQAAAAAALAAAETAWITAQTVYAAADEPSEEYPNERYIFPGISYPLPDDAASAVFDAARSMWHSTVEDFRMTAYGIPVFPVFVQAVILLVQGWYANRENMTMEVNTTAELPEGFRMLLFPYRARLGV